MLSFALRSPEEVRLGVAQRLKARRLHQNLTQEGLAARSGVSLGSLKRFERTGHISLDALVQLAFALRAENDLEGLFPPPKFRSLDEVLAVPPGRKRGRRR